MKKVRIDIVHDGGNFATRGRILPARGKTLLADTKPYPYGMVAHAERKARELCEERGWVVVRVTRPE